MKILAFDSTAKVASVAVSDGERLFGLYSIDNGLTQSELLLPMAENLLKNLKLSFSDIDIFAATVGPGSFTGVRIGVSLIKGLAFGTGKPCISVSTLDALALNLLPLCGIIVPCMDARRNQVYTATFKSDGTQLTRISEDRAISLDELSQELKSYGDTHIYLSGDGYDVAYKYLTEAGIKINSTPTLLINENAYSVTKAALINYNEGKICNDMSISPTYLRMPQAERERLEREKQNKM